MQYRLAAALAVLTILLACVGAQAGSLTAPTGYTSIDTAFSMPSYGWFGGFDILPNGNFVIHDGYAIREITRGGADVRTLYSYSGSVFGSFVRYNASNGRVYFGESSTGAIMSVASIGGSASFVADLDWNFDADFYNGQLYAVAGTGVYRINESTGASDEIAAIGESSGALTFDSAGNLIYGLGDLDWSTPRDQTIVQWTASEVAGAGGGVVLGESEADILATGVSAYGFAWKNSTELLFSETVYPAAIKSLSDLSTYTAPVNELNSITYLRVDPSNGQVSAAVSWFDEDWNQFTVLSTVVPVPEPSSLAALCSLIGLVGAVRLRRR